MHCNGAGSAWQAPLPRRSSSRLQERWVCIGKPKRFSYHSTLAGKLLGDAVSASVFFQHCLHVRGFTVGAILLGIDDAHLFSVTLHSAADYVALMMLNLRWSALKTGDRATTARYIEGAEAADLGRRVDLVGKNVSLSIQTLKAQLA